MAKQTTRKRRPVGSTVAKRRSAAPLRRNPTFGRPDLLILLALAVVTFGIYAQVIGHQFITYDDRWYITENAMVNRGVTLAGLAWAFTTFYQANWHPLTWIGHMIDSQLFAMNAGGHLLVNALIHAANTLLVFWLLLRTTRSRWPSALVAALFALHPLHVESVAWASERKDTLSTFCGLLSLIAYVRYAESPSRKRYGLVGVMLALGLMAKPMLVTWPFVMLLLDYWPLRRWQGGQGKGQRPGSTVRGLVVEKIPFFAVAAASSVITLFAQSHGGSVRTFTDAPVALRLSNTLVSYAKYLLLTFWPHDLALNYPFAPTGIPAWQVLGAAFLLIGITVFCISQRKTRSYLIVGWLWFLGTLIPVIGLVQVGGQAMADRYFYIPSIGLFVALVFGLTDIAHRWRVVPSLRAGIAGGVVLILATLTNAQIQFWSDSFTLFQHTLAITPPNVPIEYSLGLALRRSGKYDEAAAHFEKLLQIQPDEYFSLLNMGDVRSYQSRLPEAIEYYQAAIRSHPEGSKAHAQLSQAFWQQNRVEAACDEMRRASELAPDDASLRDALGVYLWRFGKIPEAIGQFHEALRLNPNRAETHANLGLILLESGKVRECISEFEAALRLKPELKVAAESLRRAQAQLSSQK